MPDCVVSVVVGASAEDVWDRLADIAAWPAWNPACLAAEVRDPVAPGARLRLVLRHPRGRGFHTHPRLTETLRPAALGWEARSVGLRARTRVAVEREREGARVTVTTETEGPMAFSYRWAMRPDTQAAIHGAMLAGLQDSFR